MLIAVIIIFLSIFLIFGVLHDNIEMLCHIFFQELSRLES